MSVINRIEVTNFLNANGESESAPWMPKYRDVVFAFHGQSTAINMSNGTGKTSVADAVLGILTRDQALVAKSRSKMAPASFAIYSHVRIEFLVASQLNIQRDLDGKNSAPFVGETWVFGMCGYRGVGHQAIFYFYPGTFEDLPLAQRHSNRTDLLPNAAFSEKRKTIPGFHWNLDRPDWRNAISEHVSLPSMLRNVEYQKKGGGDKSAELFKVKTRAGESFAQAFFYEVLAPELMTGLMDEEGEEGEHDFEDTVINTVGRVIKAKHNTEQKANELARAKRAVDALADAAAKAKECHKANATYRGKLAAVANDMHVLQDFVVDHPLPGMPKADTPPGLAGEIAAHLIVEPGKGLRVLDRGLAGLLGREPKEINRLAGNNQIAGRKLAQAVEIPCHLEMEYLPRGGHGSSSYTLAQARDLVACVNTLGQGVTQAAALEALSAAESWFEHIADTHPLRPRLRQTELGLEAARMKKDELDRKIREGVDQQKILLGQKQQMHANEASYLDLVQSGFFTEAELAEPAKVEGKVDVEHQAALDALSAFERRASTLAVWLPSWNAFCDRFGAQAAPQAIHTDLSRQQDAQRQKISDIRTAIREISTQLTAAQEKKSAHQAAIAQAESIARSYDELAPQITEFRRHFGQADAAGLDRRVVQRLAELKADMATVDRELGRLGVQVNDIQAFHDLFGSATDPEVWIGACEQEREQRLAEKNEIVTRLASLRRQRAELEKAQVAAGDIAQSVLDALHGAGVSFTPVHVFLDSCELAPARKRDVLSSFSALLFAPVIKTPADAARGAAILNAGNLPIPIFMSDALRQYAREGNLTRFAEAQLTYGLIGGITSRAVECLLDPSLVEREKRELEQRISQDDAALASIAKRLADLDPQAEPLHLARRAADALTADAPARHREAREKLAILKAELPGAQDDASDVALASIKAMQRYADLGGEDGRKRAEGEAASAQQLLSESLECLQALTDKHASLERSQQEAVEALERIYPSELYTLLDNAGKFYDADGPAFVGNADVQRDRLTQPLERSRQRLGFKGHFARAQQYLDVKRMEQEGERIEDKLVAIQRELDQWRNDLVEEGTRIASLEVALPAIKEAVEAIDHCAAHALAQYKQVAALKNDILFESTQHRLPTDAPLWQAAEALRAEIATNPDLAKVTMLANTLSDQLQSMDVKTDAGDLRRLRKELQDAEGRLLDTLRSLSSDDTCLAHAEREHLATVRSYQDADLVIRMSEQLHAIYEENRQAFETAQAAEQENRNLAADRMNYFIRSAEANLETLRKVVSRKRGRLEAHFLVDAEMATKAQAGQLVESIIETLDVEERRHEDLAKKGIGDDVDTHRQRQREYIRNLAYRHIFRNPHVRYVNPAIRRDGKPHPFTDALSTGQKTAISLMWTVRLAEFSIAKQLQRMSSSQVRRRAQARSEAILLIDGLFSDLSSRDLIESAMSGIEDTRGRFQLVGLIHNEHYQNDFNVFPVLLHGKERVSPGGGHGWVQIEEGRPIAPLEPGTVDVAETRLEYQEAAGVRLDSENP